MDVIEYYKTRNRVCDCYEECKECPLDNKCLTTKISKLEENVKILEQWAKEHPIKTNLDVVAEGLEKFGYKVDRDSLKNDCIPRFSSNYASQRCSGKCEECRKWWDEEYKEK